MRKKAFAEIVTPEGDPPPVYISGWPATPAAAYTTAHNYLLSLKDTSTGAKNTQQHTVFNVESKSTRIPQAEWNLLTAAEQDAVKAKHRENKKTKTGKTCTYCKLTGHTEAECKLNPNTSW